MPFDPETSAAFMRRINWSRARITDAAIISRREQRELAETGLVSGDSVQREYEKKLETKIVAASPVEEPVVHEAKAVFDTDELSGDAVASPVSE